MKDIMQFTASNENGRGLIRYLQKDALKEETNDLARTYIIRDKRDDFIVGYFTLKAGFVAVNERRLFLAKRTFDSIPGVELADFAVNNDYKQKHPDYQGLGKLIFNRFVIPTVKNGQNHIGFRILYIFSLPYESLIDNYKKMKFSRLSKLQEESMHRRIRPYYDTDCIFMYQIIE
jgi:hypothetical protein